VVTAVPSIAASIFAKRVHQHGIQQLVLDGLDFAIGRARHQIRIYLLHLLGDQSVLDRLRPIRERLLIAEGYRPQAQQAAAGVRHVLDVFFVAPRRLGQAAAGPLELTRTCKPLTLSL
jgi:hypothetical protein